MLEISTLKLGSSPVCNLCTSSSKSAHLTYCISSLASAGLKVNDASQHMFSAMSSKTSACSYNYLSGSTKNFMSETPSLFDIWSDLFHEFRVDGGFASHFSPLRNKNRESNGRPCLNRFFFFSCCPDLSRIHVPTHQPPPFFPFLVLWVSSFPAKLWTPDQVRIWQDEVEFWAGCEWGTKLLLL